TNHFMAENVVGYLPAPRGVRRVVADWSWTDLARVFRRAHVVTAPTPRAAALLQERTGLTGVLPISCGIDLERYDVRSAPAGAHDPTVLFVGRLDEEKRVGELITAMALLPTDLAARLEIIGDGRQR